MKRAIFWLVASSLTLSGTPGTAQGPGMQGHGAGQGMMLSMRDTDRDGFISKAEHDSWVADVFKVMDADADGRLTREEYLAVHMGPGPHAGGSQPRMNDMRERADARKAEQFAKMDSDNDGIVTREQFVANAGSNFTAMDLNKDGKVSLTEFHSWHRGR